MKWIDIEEEKPKEDSSINIIIRDEKNKYYIARYESDYEFTLNSNQPHCVYIDRSSITHWAHLCEMKEKENNIEELNRKLFFSCYKNSPEQVLMLIESGADVNYKNWYNQNPIHVAAFNGYYEVVKILIDHGAELYNKDDHNKCPLDYAIDTGFEKIINIIKNGMLKDANKQQLEYLNNRFNGIFGYDFNDNKNSDERSSGKVFIGNAEEIYMMSHETILDIEIKSDMVIVRPRKMVKLLIEFKAELYFMKESSYFERIKTDIPIDKFDLNDQENIELIKSFNNEILEICLDKELKSHLKWILENNITI